MESNQYVWQRPDWPQLTWNAVAILPALGLCRRLQGRLLHAVGSLVFDLENQVQAAFFTEEILKTSAIEGENLDIRSVRKSSTTKRRPPTEQAGK